jgi:hypothetical protein
MIRKITSGEYLRRYDNMTAVERTEYLERVGKWLCTGAKVIAGRVGEDFNARLQNILTISATWNDEQCGAFEEGARLLTTLVGRCDTWLPEMLYAKAAGRCVKLMVRELAAVARENEGERNPERGLTPDSGRMQAGAAKEAAVAGAAGQQLAPVKRGPGRPRKNALPDADAAGTAAGLQAGQQQAAGTGAAAKPPLAEKAGQQAGQQQAAGTGVPVRPKHIDQYVHLLPKKTQERATEVRTLLRDLDVARENARKLMDAGEHGDKVAQWAKVATRIDERVQGIYRELDAEWEKLVQSGRVVVDIFGNASIVPTEDTENTEPSSEDKAKRNSVRKWLTDTRYGNHDEATKKEHVRKWLERFKEYLALEGATAFEDKKLIAAANHYGIDIDALSKETLGRCDAAAC